LQFGKITEHRTLEGKAHARVNKEVLLGRIGGYSIDARIRPRSDVNAMNNSVTPRGSVAGCALHENQRVQSQGETPVRAHFLIP